MDNPMLVPEIKKKTLVMWRNRKYKDGLRLCSGCKIHKSDDCFVKDRTKPDGLTSACKVCRGIAASKRFKTDEQRCKNREYSRKNRKKMNEYALKRRRENIDERLATYLRCRLHKALKGNYKRGSAVRDLGCTIEDFKIHLESLFQPGMSWENHGRYGWHMDHILPLSSFDLTDQEQLKKACHFSNLQPLWASDNYKKSNKVGK